MSGVYWKKDTQPVLTDWFTGDQKPVHVGVYERAFEFGPRYSYWNGQDWQLLNANRDAAAVMRGRSGYQSIPWRGLAVKP